MSSSYKTPKIPSEKPERGLVNHPRSESTNSADKDLESQSFKTEPHANTGSEIRPHLECSRLELEIENAVRRDKCSRVHSLKTLAYLAWGGWPRPTEVKPDSAAPKNCNCGCTMDCIHTDKLHPRVREPQPKLAKKGNCGCTKWCPY
jgi:hypothetical protein